MLFNEILNNYLKELNCNSKKLSVLSGISESVISRYRSGERTPNDVTKIEQIADALSKIASDDGKDNYSKDEILNKIIVVKYKVVLPPSEDGNRGLLFPVYQGIIRDDKTSLSDTNIE